MKKVNRSTLIIIITVCIIGFSALIWLLFFAYIPALGKVAMLPDAEEISEVQALRECPEIALTDYDRQFMDRILNDPRIQAVEEDAKSVSFTADEAGFERYAPRPDDNYTINADYAVYGIMPLHASAVFDRTEGFYGKKLYISVNKKKFPEHKDAYTKVITVTRSDGKYIAKYRYYHGTYKKETFRYGLVSYAEAFFHAIMSV